MVDVRQETPFIIRMINCYGLALVLVVCVLVMLLLLFPLLIIGDIIVHGKVIFESVLSGLINAAIITPLYIYFFLKLLRELNTTKEKLKYLVIRDELTGVYNRRYIEERLLQAFSLAKRQKTSFGVLLLDLDHFKQINDTYSHIAGDLVIKEVAKLCESMLRQSDVFARFGGEEFSCLVNDIHITDIAQLANRINKAVDNMDIMFNGKKIHVTISIGVAKLEDHHSSIQDLMLSADKALYKAKDSGRNRVIIS